MSANFEKETEKLNSRVAFLNVVKEATWTIKTVAESDMQCVLRTNGRSLKADHRQVYNYRYDERL